MTILLSIIIPVYNRQAGLENLLDSLVNSLDFDIHGGNLEIIIVDDGSASPVTVPQLQLQHFRLVRNPANLGAPASRKRGFKLSQGSHIHFHDSDDTFSSSWLRGIMQELSVEKPVDILLTARHDISATGSQYRLQKYFHRHTGNIRKIKRRLLYRNCLGPLGGVVFSRTVAEKMTFKKLSSCQDWQMYLEAIDHASTLGSCPGITYNFHVDGNDRISHDPAKKILGFLQLSKTTRKSSIFGKGIRLFYLHTCKKHIDARQGIIKKFYNKHRVPILICFSGISLYWRFFT